MSLEASINILYWLDWLFAELAAQMDINCLFLLGRATLEFDPRHSGLESVPMDNSHWASSNHNSYE